MSFNPRLRAGGDSGRRLHRSRILVSIHASAREATCDRETAEQFYKVSIHASAREATKAGWDLYEVQQVSIHASAREATQRHGRH